MNFQLITCPQWRARPPREPIRTVAQAKRIIIHHTAGHHAELDGLAGESRAEAIGYARAIQSFHMDVNGWIDSGHNFLVCRNGLVLQGRWGTVSQIQQGRMVRSAHCPGQNDQIGVEHEHAGAEPMTAVQLAASAALIAWVSRHYGLAVPLPLHPHREYVATACPANLAGEIPPLYEAAARLLEAAV